MQLTEERDSMSAPVKKNDDITLEITGMSSDGSGIGRHDGFAVFVPNALPGEKVSVHIIKTASNYAVGKLIDVIERSSSRTLPPCPVFYKCGGCSLMHMSYPDQLVFKRQIVWDSLERIGRIKGVEVEPVIGMDDPFRYRSKGSFPFAEIEGRPAWGLYAAHSHRLIETSDCAIEKSEAVIASNAVLKWARAQNIPIYDEKTGRGVLRHVITRSLSGGDAVCVVTTGKLPHRDELIAEIREALPNVRSIVHNINPRNTNVICGEEFRVVYGDSAVVQSICGLDFEVSAESFLQVNPVQTEKLYACAVDGLGLSEEMTAADVFCGIGTISLLLAKRCSHVTGVEFVEKAVEDAYRNAKLNGIGNAEFFAGPAELILPRLVAEGRHFDAVTLDPPRKGADPAVLEAIINSGAEKLAYISCSPATLARDLRILVDGGYSIASVQPFDLFPFTSHVESVVLMSRAGL